MSRPRRTSFAVSSRLILGLVVALAGATLAACGGGPGVVERALSCEFDYLNERFGGALFLFDLADENGHFEHTYAGGTVELVVGDWDEVTGDYSFVETYRPGYAAVTRTVTGNAVFELDGDGGGSSEGTTTFADATTRTSTSTFTRTGCTVTSSRTDDEGTVFDVTSEMVSIDESTFSQSSTTTEGVTALATGSNFLDWTAVLHIEREDPTISASPDYIEDRLGAADGSGTGTYRGWLMNGQYEEGSAVYPINGDVVRTWTRWVDSSMTDVAAMGTSTVYQDGSGIAVFMTTNMMGVDINCTREWAIDQSGTLTCDDGTMQTF